MMRLALIFGALAGCHDYRQVNAGAVTPIYAGCSAEDWSALHAKAGWVAFWSSRDAIYLRRFWSPVAGDALHEYQHHLEARLAPFPDALRAARKAFRDLCAPDFEIGRDDLMKEVP